VSDLNELIATTSIKAFNHGLRSAERHPFIYNEFDLEAARKAGAAVEKKKIFDIIAKITCSNDIGEFVYVRDLIEYLEEADNA